MDGLGQNTDNAKQGYQVAVETRGIRHVHVMVRDHERSVRFYRDVFGMEVGFRDGNILFLHSPSRRDDLASHLAVTDSEKARVGDQGGYEHFGITVKERTQLDECIALAIAAGGSLVDKGEHAPGVPYAYVTDPDGYVIEI
jgi:catechol 2,3-dioxygenase-like lactoylglutathione lyase family enzyme